MVLQGGIGEVPKWLSDFGKAVGTSAATGAAVFASTKLQPTGSAATPPVGKEDTSSALKIGGALVAGTVVIALIARSMRKRPAVQNPRRRRRRRR